jgi:hypothetical protein
MGCIRNTVCVGEMGKAYRILVSGYAAIDRSQDVGIDGQKSFL